MVSEKKVSEQRGRKIRMKQRGVEAELKGKRCREAKGEAK